MGPGPKYPHGGDARAQAQQQAVVGDGRARRDEERHAGLGRRHDLELVAEEVEHRSQPAARGHLVADAHRRLPPAGAAAAQPHEPVDRPLGRGWGLHGTLEHPQAAHHVQGAAHVRRNRLLLEEAASADLGGDPGHAGIGGRAAGGAADRGALALGADDERQPVGDRHRPRRLVDRRGVVDRERLERLDQVAAVQVDQRVGRRDQLGEDVVGELVRERPAGVAGEAAVEVLAVGRGDERRARAKRGQVHDRHGHDGSRQAGRVEAAHHPHNRRDRRVLAPVDAAQHAKPRAVAGAGHLEARPLQIAQRRRFEPQHAPGHSPSPRVSATMVTNVR